MPIEELFAFIDSLPPEEEEPIPPELIAIFLCNNPFIHALALYRTGMPQLMDLLEG